MSKIRLAVVAAALTLSVTAVAAQRLLADFSGKWNVAIDAQGQSMQSLMTVEQKGDSVSGTTESQIGTANFDGVVKGDSIFFGFALDMGGQAIRIRGTGVMTEKDKMSGTMEAEGLGAFPFAAARQPN
ncbi:MAG: hypothetical protein P3B76_08550 [Gemmatimonadota bacterium]|jgi:hypothetical protein|nr:hypothetical protein [Gemmatimonadota bacterium]MDQ8168579.1 hypothetical protein [Gemmatimonadota bacterium]MDQ8172721.1 hypothetical protein [Gemmatimonadota bacterium]